MSRLAFISHNKRDVEAAREIALFLTAENVSVWFDEWEISAGDSIVEQINGGLSDCTHFIIVWSANAASSNWVRKELSAALSVAISRGSPRVIPILLDSTELPPLLSDIKGVWFEGGSERARRELVVGVTGAEPSDTLTKAVVRKYQELVHDADGPLGFKACPQCGSAKLKPSMQTDYERDDVYYFVTCLDCKWSDWSQ